MKREIVCLDTSILIDFFRKKTKENTTFYKLSDQNFTSIHNNLKLVTLNKKDFEKIEGLLLLSDF